jgi:hypothetical protein
LDQCRERDCHVGVARPVIPGGSAERALGRAAAAGPCRASVAALTRAYGDAELPDRPLPIPTLRATM